MYPLNRMELADMTALTKRDADMSMSLIDTIAANVNNNELSDAEFRQFIRNSLPLTIKAIDNSQDLILS